MANDSLTIRSFAKINWMLRVLRKRRDGFHDLETLFQTISLHDTLLFEKASETSLACDVDGIPTDGSNLVLKAHAILVKRHGAGPVAVRLSKKIPVGGGLGGGSSNAAVTLLAINRMFDLRLDVSTLGQYAAEIGSDVPFFLTGGTAWGGGRGEILESLPDVEGVSLLLVVPEETMMTGEAFAALGRTGEDDVWATGPGGWRGAVERGLLGDARLANDFEGYFFAKFPHLDDARRKLRESGAVVAMLSGSGSTIYGAYEDASVRDAAAVELAAPLRVVKTETITAATSQPFPEDG